MKLLNISKLTISSCFSSKGKCFVLKFECSNNTCNRKLVAKGGYSYQMLVDSAVARQAPMTMLRKEMMTQASEMGANIWTNLTPTATISVSTNKETVPYNRKLFHGS